jgi:transposase InsO family protein
MLPCEFSVASSSRSAIRKFRQTAKRTTNEDARKGPLRPGSPWENGSIESFNARFRDELLNGEIFYTLKKAQIIIEQWRIHYNTRRPHSALG